MAKPATEKFEVRNCFTNAVQFTAEITCAPDAPVAVKLGLAVRWAVKDGAYLSGADLSGADLSGAYLSGANLSRANLSRANLSRANLSRADLSDADLSDAYLSGANLSRADLRFIKADFWLILTMARTEVPALMEALRAGRVNGSTYSGLCACLVGSLENAGAKGLPHVASSPAEQWFVPIRPGDTPDKEGEGSFRAKQALEWATEWCAFSGVEVAPMAEV